MRTLRGHAAGRILCFSVASIGLAAGGCAEPISIHTAANPSASFAQYRSFSFGPAEAPPNGYQRWPGSAEVRRRVQPLIASALTQKGYAALPGTADFFVMFGSGRRTVAVHEDSTVAGEWQPDDENADFVEGSLVIDVFDSATGARLWHGASRAQVDQVDDAVLQRSISALLASFPAAKPPRLAGHESPPGSRNVAAVAPARTR